jgi:hypothetical protein
MALWCGEDSTSYAQGQKAWYRKTGCMSHIQSYPWFLGMWSHFALSFIQLEQLVVSTWQGELNTPQSLWCPPQMNHTGQHPLS